MSERAKGAQRQALPSLAAIDSMRHLSTSEDIVAAVAFAARAAHSDRTAYRFVTLLVVRDELTDRSAWADTLRDLMELEKSNT